MHYDLNRMSNWFNSRRKRLRMKEQKEQGLNDNINDSRKSFRHRSQPERVSPNLLKTKSFDQVSHL